MSSGMKSRSDKMKRTYQENMTAMKEIRRLRRIETSDETTKQKHNRRIEISGGQKSVCGMLQSQHDIFADDPEAMTTEFKLHILGRDRPQD